MILCDNKNHYSFIHSFILAISIAQVHYTTRKRSRLQHGYCIGVSCRSTQATVSKGLAQGPYVVARAGVEPMTLRLRVIDLTSAPPRPTFKIRVYKNWIFIACGLILLPPELFQIVTNCKIGKNSMQFKFIHKISVIQEKFLVFFRLLHGPEITC